MPLRTAFDSPDHKRRFVRGVFATIAGRYDLITRLLSYGNDRRWKRRLVRLAAPRRGERAIDLACGTGDIALLLAAHGARVVGLDLTMAMLRLARGKTSPRAPLWLTAGDMMALPFGTASVDLVTVGYGLRNVPELAPAIQEIARVLRPGGRLLSLDFNRPEQPIVRTLYLIYLDLVGGVLGWVLHRSPEMYRYIPASIRRYPGAWGVAQLLIENGFSRVRIVPLLGGLMTIHVAENSTQSQN